MLAMPWPWTQTAQPAQAEATNAEVATAAATSRQLCIASYNIRYDSKPDAISVKDTIAALPNPLTQPKYLTKTSEQPWSARRILVAEKVLSRGVDILCVQEALVRQVNDLQELLGGDWAWKGVGRDDGVRAGEFSAVFFLKTILQAQAVDYFWLSNTPFTPSKYPGAGSIRICTTVRFKLYPGTTEERPVTVINIHLDDQSDTQRQLGASMLRMRAQFEAAKYGPVVLAGDFNSPPSGSGSGAYEIATGSRVPISVPTDFAQRYSLDSQAPKTELLDLRAQTLRRRIGGGFATFTGFTAPSNIGSWARIVFVFGSQPLLGVGWSPIEYEVDTAISDDGTLASDHRPVFVRLSL